MAKTFSTMLALKTRAPHFSLPDVVSGKIIHLVTEPMEQVTVVAFICNHCPFVKYIMDGFIDIARTYKDQGVRFIAINSNDTEHYPDDSPDNMRKLALEHNYPFPYLFDETQEVAKAYMAACTPDFFVFDTKLELAYRGQMDGARPGNDTPVSGDSLRVALDCLLSGRPLTIEQRPSLGCNIKWKATSYDTN